MLYIFRYVTRMSGERQYSRCRALLPDSFQNTTSVRFVKTLQLQSTCFFCFCFCFSTLNLTSLALRETSVILIAESFNL